MMAFLVFSQMEPLSPDWRLKMAWSYIEAADLFVARAVIWTLLLEIDTLPCSEKVKWLQEAISALEAVINHPKSLVEQKANFQFFSGCFDELSRAYFAQGLCYEDLGDTAAALSSYTSALSAARKQLKWSKIVTDSAVAFLHIARCLLNIGAAMANTSLSLSGALLKSKEAYRHYKKAFLCAERGLRYSERVLRRYKRLWKEQMRFSGWYDENLGESFTTS